MFGKRKIEKPWDGAVTPFKIVGNVYFVGAYQASSHLIDTGDGLILIDTGYASTLFLVIDSIYRLGFSPRDVKYIINTHWHGDHTEGTAALSAISGAKTVIGRHDIEKARKYFDADMTVGDGDKLSLGNTEITFIETPGHTRGTVSIFFETEDNGKKYRVGMFGGAGRNTLVPEKYDYEGCREGYRSSLERLRAEKVDVFIGNHVWNNDTERKGQHLLQTGENLFIDPTLWNKFLDYCKAKLDEVIAAEEGKS